MVYVDQLMSHGWKMWGRMIKSCHLFADDIHELHSFAAKIGLKRGYFHHKSVPHYDLTANKRAIALNAGAKELSTMQSAAFIFEKKSEAVCKWHK